jgi:hypothetical protein
MNDPSMEQFGLRGTENLQVEHNTCIPSQFGLLMLTVTLWRWSVDHRSMEFYTIAIWPRPSGFEVTITLWESYIC